MLRLILAIALAAAVLGVGTVTKAQEIGVTSGFIGPGAGSTFFGGTDRTAETGGG